MNYREVDLNEEFLSKLYESGSKQWETRPPEKLYAVGEFPQDRKARKVVSIVGSRASTPYGEQIAYDTAKMLAENGVIVVSGLAYGIEAAARSYRNMRQGIKYIRRILRIAIASWAAWRTFYW